MCLHIITLILYYFILSFILHSHSLLFHSIIHSSLSFFIISFYHSYHHSHSLLFHSIIYSSLSFFIISFYHSFFTLILYYFILSFILHSHSLLFHSSVSDLKILPLTLLTSISCHCGNTIGKFSASNSGYQVSIAVLIP
jgi:phage shock protein PspC (stress-responsive transcriptional regulator)